MCQSLSDNFKKKITAVKGIIYTFRQKSNETIFILDLSFFQTLIN